MERIVRKPWMIVTVIALVLAFGYFVGAKAGFEDDDQRWELRQEFAHIGMFRGMIGLILDVTEMAADEDAAATAAIYGLEDHCESLEEYVELLEDILDDTDNPVAQRVIRMQLADKYGGLDNHEESREQLIHIITED